MDENEVCHQCGEKLPDEPWKWEGMFFCCKRCREEYEDDEVKTP